MPDIFDQLQTDQKSGDIFEQLEFQESLIKSAFRTGYQVISGGLQPFSSPLDIIHAMGIGEALDQEDIERLEEISKREGIPFDKEKYMEAVQSASTSFPTQGNIERLIEEKTGAPLTAKTPLQKGIKLGVSAGTAIPGNIIKKGIAAVTAPVVSSKLQEYGVPEPVADIVGFSVGGKASKIQIPSPKVVPKLKESGMPVRRLESITNPKKVSPLRKEKINETLEKDFKDVSKKILESSKNKTYRALKEDPNFKNKIGDLFGRVETLSKEIEESIPSNFITNSYFKRINEKKKIGISPDEFESAYRKQATKQIKQIPARSLSAEELVQQFRKNNKSLKDLFEPGKSKAENRGKIEALLDYNRSIEDALKKSIPETEFNKLFDFTNKRWSEIKDAEFVDQFINEIFDGKINYKKGRDFFEKNRVSEPFERVLGKEKFKEFETLMNDFMSSEQAMSMIKASEKQGFKELSKMGISYLIHPSLLKIKIAKDLSKAAINSLLDKPEYILIWDKGINAMKAGKFKEAQKYLSQISQLTKSEIHHQKDTKEPQ